MSKVSLCSLAFLAALACAPPPPPFAAYRAAVAPLLEADHRLQHRFTCLAVALRQREARPADLAAALGGPIQAEGARLLGALRAIPQAPTPGHPRLVQAWEDRLTAWEDLHLAWQDGTPADLQRAAAALDHARRDERGAMRLLNASLAASGPALHLAPITPLPPCGGAPKKSAEVP